MSAEHSPSTPAPGEGVQLVNSDTARAVGRRTAGAGPRLSATMARAIVQDLRWAADEAVAHVEETSLLSAPKDDCPVLVVDRAGWIDANVDSFAALLGPVTDKLIASRTRLPSAAAQQVGARVNGAEMGALMGFLSSKVLGQYDLAPQGTPRLLLVAPNIVAAQKQLDVDGDDFRRWVAMHEETHRVQFTAVPWLREHLIRESQSLAVELAPTPEELGERIRAAVTALPQAMGEGGGGLTELFATPEQRRRMAELTAVMSLLEGHADVIMDDVGPRVIRTVDTIRKRFEQRRKGAGALDTMLRRLLGLEAKMRQYSDGASFVRAVEAKVGREGFNAVWTSPETLPSALEILAPEEWVRRVHG